MAPTTSPGASQPASHRQALGIALICALIPDAMTPEPHEIVLTEGDPYEALDPTHVDEYRSYFVSHTAETAQRFNDAVASPSADSRVPPLRTRDGALEVAYRS